MVGASRRTSFSFFEEPPDPTIGGPGRFFQEKKNSPPGSTHYTTFPVVLFINGLHVSIQIGRVSLRKRKTSLYGVFLRLKTCTFDYFTKEKALKLNSG